MVDNIFVSEIGWICLSEKVDYANNLNKILKCKTRVTSPEGLVNKIIYINTNYIIKAS